MRKTSFVPTMYLTLGLALTPAAAFANHGGFHGGRVAGGQVAGGPVVTPPFMTHPFVSHPFVSHPFLHRPLRRRPHRRWNRPPHRRRKRRPHVRSRRPAPANSIAGPTNGTSCTGRIAGTPYRSGTGPRRSKPSRPKTPAQRSESPLSR